jgi:S-adenosylmethionine-diacylgycerolhomoserine-N-methlytransferase
MKKLLRKVKRLAVKIFSSKVDELFWKFRHFFDKSWVESYISKESINHPHRKILIDTISKYYPFDSALEIGCASGPNLYLLSKKFPEIKLYGIDISKKAIEIGKKKFNEEKISNVILETGNPSNLKKFFNKSIDIVFSDACLIYLSPKKINSVVGEMVRIAKKAIILCEQHSDHSNSFYNDNWIHNYKLLFGKFVSSEKIKFTKIPKEIWGGDWGKFGYIIEIIL